MYLGPLSDREMTEIVTSTVVGMPDEAVSTIVEAAGGVPLFAVEMLRSLVADGRLVITGDVAVIDGQLGSIEVPTSVQAVIGARLDRLPDSERELIRHASVLGQSFTLEGLAEVAELPADKVERLLGALVRHEILQLNRDPRSPERGQYRWVQGVLREVAYGRISLEDRSRLHLRVARHFRGLEDPELAPIAASHYVSALRHTTGPDTEIRSEMMATLAEAIERARAVHAYEQVLSLVDTAIEVVEETEPDVAAALHEAAASAAVSLGRIDEADRHVEALRRLAQTRAQLVHRSVALAGWVANVGQRSAAGIELMEPHLERWPDLSSDPDLARIAVYLARRPPGRLSRRPNGWATGGTPCSWRPTWPRRWLSGSCGWMRPAGCWTMRCSEAPPPRTWRSDRPSPLFGDTRKRRGRYSTGPARSPEATPIRS
ncbi:MAG: hypothetical protein KatS3mg011_0362 [Acidimicrobiia bacterium]|nr:MAG: hypothetical protein KatS3mg011_0362 [Acidimicrobiia bacterium]